jgi:uroporphyrin-III C-methyltransferase
LLSKTIGESKPSMNLNPATGRIVLVGAGPGDPELLTLKAVRAIAAADVLLVDDLVHEDVLLHARADARIVHVGKRGGCASTPQAFIEKLMVAEALAGRCVVRLKGGDPFMFGRGGEELATAREHGLPVEVVPGITAGIAAPSSIGVPVTHRDLAHGCIFVTGHERHGEGDAAAGVDWRALVATRLTLVIYMGVARAASIQAALCDAGLALTTPVAVISRATCSDQRHVVTSLGALTHDIAAHELASPAIIVVGAVAALANAENADTGSAMLAGIARRFG